MTLLFDSPGDYGKTTPKTFTTPRGSFRSAKAENFGPCYECPFIDPYWFLKKIKPLLPKYAE
jgi:hypothetical protein